MAKEICISSTPHETRLAILEDDQLAEIYYERENEYTLAGSVYKGRVTRVLPGMQSAFVDIGLERDAFLYVTDFLEMEDQEDTDEVERAAATGDPQRALQVTSSPSPASTQGQSQRRDGRDQRPRRGENRGIVESEAREYAEPPLQLSPSYPIEEDGSGVPASVADATTRQDQSDEQGARRLRGRRRRRGGRGRGDEGAAVASGEPLASEESDEEEPSLLEFEAAAVQPQSQPAAPRGGSPAPAPFVMPGESLSKYGAAAIEKPAPSRLVLTRIASGHFGTSAGSYGCQAIYAD